MTNHNVYLYAGERHDSDWWLARKRQALDDMRSISGCGNGWFAAWREYDFSCIAYRAELENEKLQAEQDYATRMRGGLHGCYP